VLQKYGVVTVRMAEDEKEALSLENESVHRVYDIIASHFSDTRYKVAKSFRHTGNNL